MQKMQTPVMYSSQSVPESQFRPSPVIGHIQIGRCHPRHKKSFIGSGVRYDLLLHQSKDAATNRSTAEYTRELIVNHVSGRLKVAPEHTSDRVLSIMRKPSFEQFETFKKYSTVSTGKRIYVSNLYRTLSLRTPAARKKTWRNWLLSPSGWTFIWSKYRTLPLLR